MAKGALEKNIGATPSELRKNKRERKDSQEDSHPLWSKRNEEPVISEPLEEKIADHIIQEQVISDMQCRVN